MQVTQIQTDHTLMELNCRSTADYPIRFYLDIMREFDQKHIRWHWHPELEFNVVTRGTIQYYVEDQRYTLSSGQGIMKNSNVLHMAEPDQNTPEAEMISVIMDTEFIAPAKSVIYQKYIERIHGDARLRCIPFTPEIPWQGISSGFCSKPGRSIRPERDPMSCTSTASCARSGRRWQHSLINCPGPACRRWP